MTLTYKYDLNWITLDYHAECESQRSLCSKVIPRTQTHTRWTDRTTGTTEVVGKMRRTFSQRQSSSFRQDKFGLIVVWMSVNINQASAAAGARAVINI